MRAEDYQERQLELAGWPVRVASYRLDGVYHAKADNVSPGAALARTTGATREEAERSALERAAGLLANTRRYPA